MQGAGHKAQGTKHRVQGTRHRAQGMRHRTWAARHRANLQVGGVLPRLPEPCPSSGWAPRPWGWAQPFLESGCCQLQSGAGVHDEVAVAPAPHSSLRAAAGPDNEGPGGAVSGLQTGDCGSQEQRHMRWRQESLPCRDGVGGLTPGLSETASWDWTWGWRMGGGRGPAPRREGSVRGQAALGPGICLALPLPRAHSHPEFPLQLVGSGFAVFSFAGSQKS